MQTQRKQKKVPNKTKTLKNPKLVENKKYLRRILVLLGMFIILIAGFAVFNMFGPKYEDSDSASELINKVIYIATSNQVSQSSPMNEYSIERSGVKSNPENTVAVLAVLPEDKYETAKSTMENYFTERNYSKHTNGKSGAGESINFDGSKYSCEINDWGASLNGATMVQEKSLLIACAAVKDFKK